MNKVKKKILRIRRGEYMLAMEAGGVVTTFDKDKAMDISSWSVEQFAFVIKNLTRVGLKHAMVETVEMDIEDKVAKMDEKIHKLLDKEVELDSDELRAKRKKLQRLMDESAKLTKQGGKKIGNALRDVKNRLDKEMD